MTGSMRLGLILGPNRGAPLLVDVANGEEVATAVHRYANGVIDEKLPGTDIRLPPDWALQDPKDYLEVFRQAIPAVLRESGVDPARCDRHRHRLYRLHDAAG